MIFGKFDLARKKEVGTFGQKWYMLLVASLANSEPSSLCPICLAGAAAL